MYLYFNFYVMNTLKKEQVLVEQPMPEEQEELQAIFKELDVKIQEKLDVVMNKSGSCN